MRNADTAMYHAKAAGRNTFQFFTEQMNHAAQARLRLETRLRRALRDNEFQLYYQPIVSTETGAITAAEALIRWNDPEHGMVPPMEFIPVAEDLGLIEEIGAWVLHEACRQNHAWQATGKILIPIAVNLSAEQFRTGAIVDIVAAALAQAQLDPSWLHLEITESLLMEHTDQTIRLLSELNGMGVHLSIDDFGTGYSSLSYLTRFPIQKLKIDKSFVRDLRLDRSNAAVTSGVIALGHSLQLTVLAEGVETAEQLEFLRSKGCDELQGYYFSKPVSAADFERLVAQGTPRIGALVTR
jgi:EAL domain-containing protein (putative c-di-GMP-specific phosphodiesterase class I)